MSMQPAVTVIIPTFNRAADIREILDELSRQSWSDFAVVVVDNSSSDHTEEVIKQYRSSWKDRLSYVVKKANGPASARNVGAARCVSPYVMFLDSDVRPAPDWIEVALKHLRSSPSCAAVSGQVIYDFDHRLVNAYGGDLGKFGLAWDLNEGSPADDIQQAMQRIWANCSALMMRRDIFLTIGGFDERFFYGYEDSDLGWKVNLIGFQQWVLPELRVYHKVQPETGIANPQIVFHYCKNRLRSLIKNSSAASLPFRLLAYFAYSSIDVIARGPRLAKLKALVWNCRHLGETLSLRGDIQALRKCSDNDIFSLGQRRWFPAVPLAGKRRRGVAGSSPSAAGDREVLVEQDDRV